MSREAAAQVQAMYNPPDMGSVLGGFGNHNDGMMSSVSHNQVPSHNGSLTGPNRDEHPNAAGQTYGIFPHNPVAPISNGAYRAPPSATNYGLATPYGNEPLNGLSSFHPPTGQSFGMPSSFSNGKISSEHLNGMQQPHFSFSSIQQNGSSLADLQRSNINSSNGFHASDFTEGFGMNTSSGLGLSSLSMQQQQFPDGFGRFQERQYSAASNPQQSIPSQFPQNHSNSSDLARDMSQQMNNTFISQSAQSYDTIGDYMGGILGGHSSNLGLPRNVEDALCPNTDLPPTSNATNDLRSFIRPYLDQYVRTPNRLAFGERTVIVMSSKVAQKSYGNEKRFLCPPPTAIMVGNSWWSDVHRPGEGHKLAPPRVVVSISGEPSPPEGSVEWAGAAGKPFDVNEPPSGTTYVGRCVGKQLYISEADEKRKKVEALVKITAVAANEEEKVIGVFSSKPIKVISKPSKKRQSAKNLELCINHGSTVSLFHRLRSQTVSTKYLCVSASGSSFKGSDGAALMGTDVRSRPATPAFVARTSSWDPFIMYIVDVNKPIGGIDAPPPPPPQPDYPSPPPNAIPFTTNGSQIPIYYNQTIVLQCLTSGVVSPILIIRKVDRQTTVVGGGNQEGGKSVPDHHCAPGEVYGDPVSQLHKIAFEVYEANKATPEPGNPGVSGAFLSCMAEKVNTYRPVDGRQWNKSHSRGSDSPVVPDSPSTSTPTSANGSVDYFSVDSSVPPSPAEVDAPNTNDGGRVKKGKRATSSAGGITKSTAAKGRKRPNSAGSAGGKRSPMAESAGGASSGALWQVDIGESSVWTIVGTEQIRYNFYVPPVLFDNQNEPQPSSFPVPSKPVTPFPAVVKYLPPDRASEAPKGHGSRLQLNPTTAKMLTLYGENFSKMDVPHVFFGSEPSPYVEVRCTEVVGCLPPEIEAAKRRPIILVRQDGVVFPSSTLYP